MKRKPKPEKPIMREYTPGEWTWLCIKGDAVPARAASLRPQPPSAFSLSGIAIAKGAAS